LNEIIHGNCLELIQQIPSKSIDLIIGDPPFNNIVSAEWDKQWTSDEEYFKWCEQVIVSLERVMKEGAALYWYAPQMKLYKIQPILMKFFYIRNIISLCFPNMYCGLKGAWNAKHCWMKKWQPIFFCTKGESKYHLRKKTMQTDLFTNNYDYWVIAAPQSNFKKDKRIHIAQKPIGAAERMIIGSTEEGDTILVPFVGSGSECVIAKRLNRNFIGFEIDFATVRIAEERLTD